MTLTNSAIEIQCTHAIRFLACDAIEKAKSGHPGLPLGAAPAAFALWARHLRHDPTDPSWIDRDRFVLSAGHGSALLYALLHLSGYDLSLEDLRAFRQWGSPTPGHPESHITAGVEVTTGPLGQGLANAVGLAATEAHLAATFNRPGHTIVDHHTYALAGDGDLMEGVAYEACAWAGHVGLGKLIVLFDANRISLAGSTALSTSENVTARFEAAGWSTLRVQDGNDLEAIDAAISKAKEDTSTPTLIEIRSIIGFGSPSKQDTHNVHGAPLGPEELVAAKQALGWPTEPAFFVPDEVREYFADLRDDGRHASAAWNERFDAYLGDHPDLASELERRMAGQLPADWAATLPVFDADAKGVATRKASETVMQSLAENVPELIGGSADLNPSTFTWLKGRGDFQARGERPEGILGDVGGGWGPDGRNVHFGVREHAMGSIANGMARHGGVIPYTATFLVFADYMRPPIRLAALSEYRSIFLFTHDSIGVGEDGPTHQPVEQTMSLRLIPDLVVIRPCDANETREAWKAAVKRPRPTALILSRQALPTLDRSDVCPAAGLHRGGYILWESLGAAAAPEIILIGTGSEVHVVLDAGRALASEGRAVRVVSLPSWELFEAEDEDYRESVLPKSVRARLAVEAGRTAGWERYVGDEGRTLGVDRFGISAPGGEVLARLGFTTDAVLGAARELLT